MMNLSKLPTPMNLTIWWNFGSLLGLVFAMQIFTGLMISMHYSADAGMAFSSLAHILRDVNEGWFLRGLHANGASFFFICIYAHIGRGLYYGSYGHALVWLSGVAMFLTLMAVAFMGYVLPWGQMSFWGATVITNLLSALPYGSDVVLWVWGGYSVSGATLSRFYSLHFVMPFLLVGLVLLHLSFLHVSGSSNPLGIVPGEKIPFHSYFTWKDIVGFVCLLSVIMFVSFFYPNFLFEPDNYIPANAMSTPAHIVPEWYFLFSYAILRSIPSKLGGVLGLFSSIVILGVMPFLSKSYLMGNCFYPMSKLLLFGFILSFVLLTIGGSWPVDLPYTIATRFFSFMYFLHFVCHVPIRKLMDY